MPYICIGLSTAATSQATAVTAMENAVESKAYSDWQLTEEQWAAAPAIEHQQDEKDESVEARGSKAEAASTKSTTE